MRVNHTYGRGGALAHLAAYDVHRARMFGRTEAPRSGTGSELSKTATNATAQPFQRRFTTSDLDDLLARLDRHTTDHHHESSAALAE
ncbi:hypothetical protein [Streptomyces sp. NBC_01013]|uniref:hypothetical protein n=1 Tax=Streptomyces sp. NBC_01013 TaxID=2903718 RepID=UPI00386F0F0F|nr:hypothetical protein OG538_05560 [Streptomyces sp. NBC_01013]